MLLQINTLQVENESMYDKLHLAEERSEDGDAKSMHMEREVFSMINHD